MARKIIALVTLSAFMIFTVTCTVHKTKTVPAKTTSAWKGKKVDILGVGTTSGGYVKFMKNKPGRIVGDAVVGTIELPKEVEIPQDQVKEMEMKKAKASGKQDQKVAFVITRDGKRYEDVILRQDRLFKKTEVVSIPLAEVESVQFRKTDPAMSFLASVGVAGGVLLGGLLIIALTKESCPFIYSYDGERYVFDAEPYGGATSEGLKRTEWCRLEHLKEVRGEYRILLTNEVDETQHTDELKLWVVDHQASLHVVADETGRMRTVAAPVLPVRAFDGKGRDLLPLVSLNDQRFWVTPALEKDPEKKETLKDELVFEFPKPPGARRAKLVFNGCNTLWASQMVKRFLELYGEDVGKTYAAVRTPGPVYQMLMAWNEREELYRLKIRVEAGDGWKAKGTIVGGGPFVSEDRVYDLDLADVPGDTLRIKLVPPASFWMVNYLVVDYTEDRPVQVTEVEAAKAVDGPGRDVRELLAAADGRYVVMPNIGDAAEIIYTAPPPNPNLERTFFIKAGGYYDIHLEAKGPCQNELLHRFLVEPGSAVQYAFKQYLEFQKENMRQFLGR